MERPLEPYSLLFMHAKNQLDCSISSTSYAMDNAHLCLGRTKNKTRLNFASKTGHLDWFSKNLDLYEISNFKIYNFFLLATYAIRSATFQFLLVINGAISDRQDDTRQMTLSWRFKVRKVRTDYFIRFATHDLLLVFYSNYSAISPGKPVFQQMTLIWPSKVSKSQTENAIWFVTNDFLLTFYINHSGISHGNPVFQQTTSIWPSKFSKGQNDYAIRFATHDLLLVFLDNFSASSHGNPVFQQMTQIWPFMVIKFQSDYAIRFATHDL